MGTLAWHPRLTSMGSCRVVSACPLAYSTDRLRMSVLLRSKLWEQRRGPLPEGATLHPAGHCDADCVEPTHQVLTRSRADSSIPETTSRVSLVPPAPRYRTKLGPSEPYRAHRRAPGRADAPARTCKWCLEPFSAAGLGSRVAYCSPEHRRLATNLRQVAYDHAHSTVVPIAERVGVCASVACGREFSRAADVRLKACCSEECRLAHKRANERARRQRVIDSRYPARPGVAA